MFEFSQAEIDAQMADLPLAFRIWFQWMFIVIVLAPILFVRHRQAKVAIAFSVVFVVVQLPLVRMVGLTNLLSLSHLLIWGPLAFYLLREVRTGGIPIRSPFGAWAAIAVATAIVSLVFDVRDFGRWLGGARSVVQPAPEIEIPWLWIGLIVLSLTGAAWYAAGGPRLGRGPAAMRSSDREA